MLLVILYLMITHLLTLPLTLMIYEPGVSEFKSMVAVSPALVR